MIWQDDDGTTFRYRVRVSGRTHELARMSTSE
jgi:hypothetical protein